MAEASRVSFFSCVVHQRNATYRYKPVNDPDMTHFCHTRKFHENIDVPGV